MFLSRALSVVILLACVAWLLPGCSNQDVPKPSAPVNNPDESIVPDSEPAPNPKVQNGDIYDKAILKAADVKTLIVPDNAKVEGTDAGGAIELFVKKTQSFGGHPPEPMTLAGARKQMGW